MKRSHLPSVPRRPHNSLNTGNSTTLDKQAAYKVELPTLPLPATQCPWRRATCLQPSLETDSCNNGVNIAQTNTSLDFSGEPLRLLLLSLLLKSIWQMPWECNFLNGLEHSLLLTPAMSLSMCSVRNQKAPIPHFLDSW